VSKKMTTGEPTTGEIVRALRDAPNYNGMAGTTTTVEDIAADRLESQEQTIAALTARAEQSERERDALISSIERLRTKKIVLCSICEFEDLIACCHKNHCEGYQLFKRRGLPQEGEGK
jgi:hypothetical protein